MVTAERQPSPIVEAPDGFEVRHARAGEEEAIVALLQSVFEGWPHFDLGCTPLEHWTWKYRGNPIGPSKVSVLAGTDRIVGCCHANSLLFTVCGETRRAGLATDIGVHADFRGRGLSKPLRRHVREVVGSAGFHFALFFTTSPILYKTFSRDRPRFPHRIANLVRVRDLDRQLQAIPVDRPALMRLGYRTAVGLNQLQNLWRSARYRHQTNIPEPAVRQVDGFDERIEPFCQQLQGHYQFMLQRSREYLNWRYADPRAGSFCIRQAEQGDRVVGYSVLMINRFRPDYPVGYVVDLLTLPDRPDAAEALVADAVRSFDEEGINLVCCQVPARHDTREALARHGFVDSRLDLTLFFGRVSIRRNAPELLGQIQGTDPRRVHFCYGDVDSVPVAVPEYLRPGG